MIINCTEGNHQGPGPFCTRCGQRIPDPVANAANASCSEGNHLGPGPFCTRCGQRILANSTVTSKAKMSLWKKIMIGVGGTIGVLFLIGIIGTLGDEPENGRSSGEGQEPATAREGFVADCTGRTRGGVIDVADIPECIERGEFEDDPLRRVKVRGYVSGDQLGKFFKIYGTDSQDRPVNGSISVDHQETYDTLIRLDQGDWVNLSCIYHSFRLLGGYVDDGDTAYAVVSLSDCIDLK